MQCIQNYLMDSAQSQKKWQGYCIRIGLNSTFSNAAVSHPPVHCHCNTRTVQRTYQLALTHTLLTLFAYRQAFGISSPGWLLLAESVQ